MESQWLSELATNGFAVFRGLVEQQLVEAARKLVQLQLREDLNTASQDQIRGWTNRSFVPVVESDDRLLDLYRCSPLKDMAVELVDPFPVLPLTRAQVQVRLSAKSLGQHFQASKDLHCDGVACPHLANGQLNSFQLLIGVLLTDLPAANGGAVEFRVGGHLAMASFFNKGGQLVDNAEVPAETFALPAVPFCGGPGDVVISHHLTPHAVGHNASALDRLMVYFRVRVTDHDCIAQQQLTEPWVRMPRLAFVEHGGQS
jgi:hypothetical protein